MLQEIKITSIGSVRVEGARHYLSINPEYAAALLELDGFSHINVLWWGHNSDSPKLRMTTEVVNPYIDGPKAVGVFATRSEVRPNPVLVTVASILSIDFSSGIVELPWIDAEDGSPIIDIKPYQPCSDRVEKVCTPQWCASWPQKVEDSARFNWEEVFNF